MTKNSKKLGAKNWPKTDPKIDRFLAKFIKSRYAGLAGEIDFLGRLPLYFALKRGLKSIFRPIFDPLRPTPPTYRENFGVKIAKIPDMPGWLGGPGPNPKMVKKPEKFAKEAQNWPPIEGCSGPIFGIYTKYQKISKNRKNSEKSQKFEKNEKLIIFHKNH